MDALPDEDQRRERAADLADELAGEIDRAREDAREDPFGNPVLRVALWLTRHFDRGEIGEEDALALVQHLGRGAVLDRAERLRAYVGLDAAGPEPLQALARGNAEAADTFARYKDETERFRFAAVFTAHPTFGMTRDLAGRIARMASQEEPGREEILGQDELTFRPDPGITLQDEFAQARFAVLHARDAIDGLNGALLDAARRLWPDRWTELAPRPVTLGSWVGCDTDGRTDIGWWDTLRYRLESKRGQFTRILQKLPDRPAIADLRTMVADALAAVERQLALAPALASEPSLEALRDFALALVGERETALPDSAGLIAALDRALCATGDDDLRMTLCLVRAGCVAHGVSIALPHFRLNASQLHNAMRRTIALDGEPTEPAQRRAYLGAVNGALDKVAALPVDFGSLAAERASASRMMMTVAQIVKHLDSSRPVRFLVAETETGYTLLSALWLACRFGVADHVEISPLFETAEALEQGPRIIDEALRSRHFCAYLRRHGRFCIQFGYSDSGRYVGQITASYWIERLRLRLSELLTRYGLQDVELVLFDTHGESAGRGAHPASLADRLAYLAPPWTRRLFDRAGIRVVRESSFQGSDGYLLFGTPELAGATIARIAEDAFRAPEADEADPIYAEPDFATEFFQTARQEMTALVDDPGYAALIGTFGPSLLDKTGSRPSARQAEGSGPATIRHPRELRAIPNNAILHQLGWLANSLHGLGHAASRAPDLFGAMRERSDRFDRAYRLAEHAMRSSDLDVMRAYVDSLDPGSWFDRARRTGREGRREELLGVAAALRRLDLSPALRRLFGTLTADWLKLKAAAGETPGMSVRLTALHALRLAVIHRLWLSSAHVPDFRPQDGVTRALLAERILRLDIPGALAFLAGVFPLQPDPTLGLDFGEAPGPREGGGTYEALHRDLLDPMRRSFDLVREISGAIQHEIGAFG
ncbi:phosphoenolpyruvate carboxylase [uncultured Enterovirga sp.]|uniref:phosphoenolpyruvate carboxylase n=1 Tax=uncultured Enterovirga sp. TaxID=2026352 RepID=UPI0035C9621A